MKMKKERRAHYDCIETLRLRVFVKNPDFVGHIEVLSTNKTYGPRFVKCKHIPTGQIFEQNCQRLCNGILPPKYRLPIKRTRNRKNTLTIQKIEQKMDDRFPERKGKFQYIQVQKNEDGRNIVTVRHIETDHLWHTVWENLHIGCLPHQIRQKKGYKAKKYFPKKPVPKKPVQIIEVKSRHFVAFTRTLNQTSYFEIGIFDTKTEFPENITVLQTEEERAKELYTRFLSKATIFFRRSHPMSISVPPEQQFERTAWKLRSKRQIDQMISLLSEQMKEIQQF